MSAKIQKRFHEIINEFDALPNFAWDNKWCYGSWLAQTYSYVQHSTRIVTHAGCLFPLTRNSFHKRFCAHADEEKDHERLLINDLKDLGYTLKDFEVFPESSAFFQIQHYWIERVNPISLMGYILVLEGLANKYGKELTANVVKNYNKKGSSFLRVHSEEDVGHIEKALKMLDDVNKEEEDAVLANMELSAHLYRKMLEAIQAAAKAKKVKAA